MNQKELDRILDLHEKYLKNDPEGQAAFLYGEDLGSRNFLERDLRGADFSQCNLEYADFKFANLERAVFYGANLHGADFKYSNLKEANMICASALDTDFGDANLEFARIQTANFSGSSLSGAFMENVCFNECTMGFLPACPMEGSFIAWKKAKKKSGHEVLVKLKITKRAKRSSGTTRKCRASKAFVLGFYDAHTGEQIPLKEAYSGCDPHFLYKKNEFAVANMFDEDRWNECSNGIHFFLTKQEAKNYIL